MRLGARETAAKQNLVATFIPYVSTNAKKKEAPRHLEPGSVETRLFSAFETRLFSAFDEEIYLDFPQQPPLHVQEPPLLHLREK